MIETKELKDSLKDYTFIDLFCGLGGFRIALESFGAKCVFSSDNDKHVSETYFENFNDNCLNDITKIDEKDIPNHDILCGGFPCQAFSISGKKLGFEDTRGTLFRDVVRIAEYHKPKILFLENVKHLLKHDNGNTFKIIKYNIENIGYNMYYKVLNASQYGVPQSRERIYMVCVRKDIDNKSFEFPKPLEIKKCVKDVLIDEKDVDDYFYLKNKEVKYVTNRNKRNLYGVYEKPNRVAIINKGSQGDRIYDISGQGRTLVANGGGSGAKTGFYKVNNQFRKLLPRECARLMGFPDEYKIIGSVNQSWKQFGNSVVIDVLQYIIKEILKVLKLLC